MSQNSSEEISVQRVFDEISKYLKNEQLYERLLNILHEEPNYKRLLKTGENQFFDAPSESSIETESAKSRLTCAKVNFLAVQIENDIDKIVREKFEGEFLNNFKDKVLQAILQLSSGQVTSSAAASPIKSEKNEQKTVLSQTNNCVQNGNGVKKEEDKITNGQAVSSLLAALDKDNCDPDLCIISFDDVSSVHTSDLSSFEDEISLSSDEEFGAKKRLSLKEVQEKLEKSQLEEMESEEADEEAMNAEDAQCNSAVNGNELSSTSQKSQRRRKPNLKYTEEDDLMPLKKKSVGKFPKSSRSVSGDTPRKRGRPRKHST